MMDLTLTEVLNKRMTADLDNLLQDNWSSKKADPLSRHQRVTTLVFTNITTESSRLNTRDGLLLRWLQLLNYTGRNRRQIQSPEREVEDLNLSSQSQVEGILGRFVIFLLHKLPTIGKECLLKQEIIGN
jgi:hypothetical protein